MKRAEMPHRALLQLALALVGVAHGGEFQGDDGGPPGSGPPPEPPVGCYSGDGTDYEGGARFTVSGKPCLKWDVIVWTTSYADLPGNFCRNPDGEPWPWCFYGPDAEDWEQCDVPVCPSTPSPPSSPPLPPPPPPVFFFFFFFFGIPVANGSSASSCGPSPSLGTSTGLHRCEPQLHGSGAISAA